jgi:hypothetical protein
MGFPRGFWGAWRNRFVPVPTGYQSHPSRSLRVDRFDCHGISATLHGGLFPKGSTHVELPLVIG